MTAKQALAQKIHDDRIARFWAYTVIVVMLLFSLSANVLSALEYGRDPIGLGLSGLPPIALFVSSTLLERMKHITWYVVVGFVFAIIVALGSSWYHITTLAMHHHTPWFIAGFLPLAVDVPMLLAGKSLIDHKPTVKLPIPATPVKRTSKATPTKRTVKAISSTS